MRKNEKLFSAYKIIFATSTFTSSYKPFYCNTNRHQSQSSNLNLQTLSANAIQGFPQFLVYTLIVLLRHEVPQSYFRNYINLCILVLNVSHTREIPIRLTNVASLRLGQLRSFASKNWLFSGNIRRRRRW